MTLCGTSPHQQVVPLTRLFLNQSNESNAKHRAVIDKNLPGRRKAAPLTSKELGCFVPAEPAPDVVWALSFHNKRGGEGAESFMVFNAEGKCVW